MAIHQSGEDYLETILMLQKRTGHVRSIDIAQHLGYSKPSISRAMSILKGSGHIVMEPDGGITLTELGREVAEKMYERHYFLTKWLEKLGVSPDVAEQDACRIEHHISSETFEHIKEYAEQTMGTEEA